MLRIWTVFKNIEVKPPQCTFRGGKSKVEEIFWFPHLVRSVGFYSALIFCTLGLLDY